MGSNEKNEEKAHYFDKVLKKETSIKELNVNIEDAMQVCIEVTVEFEEEK